MYQYLLSCACAPQTRNNLVTTQTNLKPIPDHYTFLAGAPRAELYNETDELRKPSQYKTTCIPDFRSLHLREQRQLHERKLGNQVLTKPTPFVFQQVRITK